MENKIIRIKELRQQKGLSQLELANKFNVAQTTVSSWENGTREPDNDTLKSLADFFNCSVDYILRKTDSIKISDNNPWNDVVQKCITSGIDPKDINDIVDVLNRNKNK